MRVKTFRHSGNLGDIVYSLPAVKALGGGIFYVDYRTQYAEKPPLGRETALMMAEFLETQDYVERAALYEGQPVDYDLDRFRDKAVPICILNLIKSHADNLAGMLLGSPAKELRQLLIPNLEVDLPQCHWDSAGLAGQADLSAPWIASVSKKVIADIVVCKTPRYAGKLDWFSLKEYSSRSIFVGLEAEWRNFRKDYFDIGFYLVDSLLDFAQVIAGAKLYIGNQSFGLALADAMLIPRVADLSNTIPIRIPASKAHRTLTRNIIESYVRQ